MFIKTLTDEQREKLMYEVNHTIGIEAFNKLFDQLPQELYAQLENILAESGLALHNSGYRGISCEYADGTWSNEGFEL